MNYNGLDKILNTKQNMTTIRSTSADTATDTLRGVDWFKFNNVIATNIYVNSDSWIGIGTNSAQLKICSRDGKIDYLYREEGTIFSFYRFVKIRFEGSSYYNSSNAQYKIIYELFLFDTGDMFLNVIQAPTNSSYWGVNQIIVNGTTKNLLIFITTGSGTMLSFYHLDSAGLQFDEKTEKINLELPFEQKYLISDNAGKYYTIQENALMELSDIIELTAQVFTESGLDTVPDGTLLQTLVNPKILYWFNSDAALPEISATLHAIPYPQTVKTQEYFMTHPSIKGLKNIEIDADNVLTALSFDGSIWQKYGATGWVEVVGEQDGMTAEELQAVTAEQYATIAITGHYWLRFVIQENSVLRGCKVNYVN